MTLLLRGTTSSGHKSSDTTSSGHKSSGDKNDFSFWSKEESGALEKLIRLHGTNWKKLAGMLPGRTEYSMRNRWQRMQKNLSEHDTDDVLLLECHHDECPPDECSPDKYAADEQHLIPLGNFSVDDFELAAPTPTPVLASDEMEVDTTSLLFFLICDQSMIGS